MSETSVRLDQALECIQAKEYDRAWKLLDLVLLRWSNADDRKRFVIMRNKAKLLATN